ncbi:MAG: glycosyltransferase family 39 protein [Ignisphaera sp.]|nr:glycosyltransferase family 39 protein [Ignisphaera sp.]MCX8168118.1 glycosyltransferase family 39 protein [Ignisphaera sp.]MDW8085447.1 glycosyltransferase family 39 protein [Ignisphaera sp.]
MRLSEKILSPILLIVIILINVWLSASSALYLEQEESSRFPHAKGYVSDEVWYVNAARNILRNIFRLTPKIEKPKATLVYAQKDGVEKAKLVAPIYNINVIYDSFMKINALYVEAINYNSIEIFAARSNATDIVYGWILGDSTDINKYMNYEHPPSAKYLIALMMLIFGDRPLFWRIPSIIMGVVITLLSYLITYAILRSREVSLIASAFVAVDPMIRHLSSIAILDIHVAAFTLIAIYLALRNKLKEALLVLGFASTFKFTALTAFIPLLFIYIRDFMRRSTKFLDVLSASIEYLFLAILSFVFFQILLSVPIIIKTGINAWFSESVLKAISWHLSLKCIGAECPTASAPWDWFFGLNSFPLYIDTHGRVLYAAGFVPAYAISFVLLLFTLPYRKYSTASRDAWYVLLGLFIGYCVLWIAGSKTQYSFYAVQLTAPIYIFLIIQLYEYLDRERIALTLKAWREVFAQIWSSVIVIFR